MSKDLWVIFDGYGNQVFLTYERQYANFNNMSDSQYNKVKCSINNNVLGFTNQLIDGKQSYCQKDIVTGEITIITHERGWKPKKPHIPAP